MQEIKSVLSIIAVILTIVGYIPYIRDTLKGKTTPHVYTWFIWAFVTAIAYGLQVEGGGGSRFMGNFVCCYNRFFYFRARSAGWKERYYYI